jgi:hypothetical protein
MEIRQQFSLLFRFELLLTLSEKKGRHADGSTANPAASRAAVSGQIEDQYLGATLCRVDPEPLLMADCRGISCSESLPVHTGLT